jgi:8-oxo-dGTP diphosphatase
MGPLSRMPKGMLTLLREIGRHVLRHPVPGIAMAARTKDGRWLFIRRADTGTWALVGGTLEWGETLRACVARELEEEAGVVSCEIVRLVGVFSRPDRDPRFHAVTTVVECLIEPPVKEPVNPLEIREVRLCEREDVPDPLALGMADMFLAATRDGAAIVE